MAEDHTGGMIALVPADPDQLAIAGGEPVEDLHLTLAYLGDDVPAMPDEQRAALLGDAARIAAATPPLEAEVMGHAAFNPTGAHDREPCAVYLVTGDALPAVKSEVAQHDVSEHPVFLPHITAGYGVKPEDLSFVGPLVFDRLRVALADEVHDFPLGVPAEPAEEDPMPQDAVVAATPVAEEGVVEPAGPVENGEFPITMPVVVIEGLDTSDGRFLAVDSLQPRPLPLSLLAQPQSMHGGEDAGPAGIVGRIDTLERRPGPEVISKRTGQPFPEGTFVWSGTGHMKADAQVGEFDVAELFRRGYLRGISVDLAGMDFEVLGDDGGAPLDPENPRRFLVTHSAEIAAATLVPIPAFGDAYAEMGGATEVMAPPAAADLPAGLAASAAPAWRSTEVGDQLPWAALVAAAGDGMPVRIPPDAVDQLTQVIDSGEQRDAADLATAVLEHIAQNWALTEPVTVDELPAEEDTMSTSTRSRTVLADDPGPLDDEIAKVADEAADEEEGDPTDPQSCIYDDKPATHSILYQDGDQYVPVCEEDDQRARDELTKAGEVVSGVVQIDGASGDAPAGPPVDGQDAVTAAGPPADLPPIGWFRDPQLPELTPLTVTSDGRVFGHLASWAQDHVGLPGQRVRPPRSVADYAYFHVGALTVAGDSGAVEISVGKLTMDTGHAETSLGHRATVAHYDHSGSVIAQVCCGEDQHGIWYAGVLMPGVDELTVRRFRGCGLSGDWRRIGTSLELVAALSVPVPGFPVPRARVASGRPMSLVAAGAVLPAEHATGLDVEDLADRIAARLDARREAGELAARHTALVAGLDENPGRAATLLAELDERPARFAGLLAEFTDEPPAGEDPKDFLGGMPPQLKKSWLAGEIAAKIRWGTDGDFDRCVVQAREHDVPEAQQKGMCNNLHREATGQAPGKA